MADFYGIIARATSSNTPAILTAAGTALAANSQRGAWMIQNLGTNALFVKYGTGASSSVFNVVLRGGTGNDDGSGGSLAQEQGVVWVGEVTVAGTSPRYVVTELTA